jgi:hypothetical protein
MEIFSLKVSSGSGRMYIGATTMYTTLHKIDMEKKSLQKHITHFATPPFLYCLVALSPHG